MTSVRKVSRKKWPTYYKAVIFRSQQIHICCFMRVTDFAAFDAVDHTVMCDRARADFGIDGTALNWLRSFITSWSQSVIVGNESSPPTPCTGFRPRISLPVLMYVLPVNDVIASHKLQHHQYAEWPASLPGTSLITPFVWACIQDVSCWFMENSLLLNANKIEAIVFGTR